VHVRAKRSRWKTKLRMMIIPKLGDQKNGKKKSPENKTNSECKLGKNEKPDSGGASNDKLSGPEEKVVGEISGTLSKKVRKSSVGPIKKVGE